VRLLSQWRGPTPAPADSGTAAAAEFIRMEADCRCVADLPGLAGMEVNPKKVENNKELGIMRSKG
jgi:hypothetical protein